MFVNKGVFQLNNTIISFSSLVIFRFINFRYVIVCLFFVIHYTLLYTIVLFFVIHYTFSRSAVILTSLWISVQVSSQAWAKLYRRLVVANAAVLSFITTLMLSKGRARWYTTCHQCHRQNCQNETEDSSCFLNSVILLLLDRLPNWGFRAQSALKFYPSLKKEEMDSFQRELAWNEMQTL